MGVQVDEPGSDDQAGNVNDRRFRIGLKPADGDNSTVLDGDVGHSTGLAGAVDDEPPFEDEVRGLGGSGSVRDSRAGPAERGDDGSDQDSETHLRDSPRQWTRHPARVLNGPIMRGEGHGRQRLLHLGVIGNGDIVGNGDAP